MAQDLVHGIIEEEENRDSAEEGEEAEESADDEEDVKSEHMGAERMNWLDQVVPTMERAGRVWGELY